MSEYTVDFNDRNMLYFGAGEIKLESNQTLFIDEGAVVYGCVKAIDAENIEILLIEYDDAIPCPLIQKSDDEKYITNPRSQKAHITFWLRGFY